MAPAAATTFPDLANDVVTVPEPGGHSSPSRPVPGRGRGPAARPCAKDSIRCRQGRSRAPAAARSSGSTCAS